MDEGGNTQKLILDDKKLTKAMAFSQVHQSDRNLFVGTPFAGKIFVFPNDEL